MTSGALRTAPVLRFPYQFRRDGEHDFFLFSPAIGSGWMPIFERLCEAVDRELTEEEKGTFRWTQVKEKMGTFRAHFTVGVPEWELPPGTVRSAKEIDVFRRVLGLIERAERDAGETCERCGASPAAIDTTGGWLQTLCARCAADLKSRYEAEDDDA